MDTLLKAQVGQTFPPRINVTFFKICLICSIKAISAQGYGGCREEGQWAMDSSIENCLDLWSNRKHKMCSSLTKSWKNCRKTRPCTKQK